MIQWSLKGICLSGTLACSLKWIKDECINGYVLSGYIQCGYVAPDCINGYVENGYIQCGYVTTGYVESL